VYCSVISSILEYLEHLKRALDAKACEGVLTGALKGVVGISSCGGGEEGAMLNAACGVEGVIGAGTVYEDCVDGGV
jgi:hypothetical protein